MPGWKILANLGLVLTVLAGGRAKGQADGWVQVESNLPASTVVLDSVPIGITTKGPFAHRAGPVRIVLVPPDADSWLLPRPTLSDTVTSGDTLQVRLDFPYIYRIETTPFGAAVILDEPDRAKHLGDTPVLLTLPTPIQHELRITKRGYRAERVTPGNQVVNLIQVQLTPDGEGESAEMPGAFLPRRRSGRWIIVVAAAGWAVASGAVAAHYKSKADDLYDRYRISGDPLLRSEISRYDTYAAVALGSMQVGIGVIALKLLLR